MGKNTKPVRGMKDWLAAEMAVREKAMEIISSTYRSFGFERIDTPSVEHIELLTGGQGGDNEKLIYKIMKRGDKLNLDTENPDDLVDSGLRYDLTVPLSRFYADNHSKLPTPTKVIQMGNVWRAERPQKGRYRQFVQCDIDIIGENTINGEIDLIKASTLALENLGFGDVEFKINDRRVLYAIASFCGFEEKDYESVFITLDKLDKIGCDGIEKELTAKEFDNSAIEKIVNLTKKFLDETISVEKLNELIGNAIPEEIVNGLSTIINAAHKDNVSRASFDPTLVRGMGYYTGTIYEIKYKDYPGSVGGGGRYDKMIGRMLKNDIPAVGLSFGFERLMDIIITECRSIGESTDKIVLLFDKDSDYNEVYKKAYELRKGNVSVSVIQKAKKMGKQLNNLKEFGFTHFAVFGEDEVKPLD